MFVNNRTCRALFLATALCIAAAAVLLSDCSKKPERETAPEPPDTLSVSVTTDTVAIAPDTLSETDDTLRMAYDTLRDTRDGKVYRTVNIGKRIWMAENLNYRPQTGNSWCHNGDDYYCDKYGRLYDWETAKTACPPGWHLPSYQEWDDLGYAAGGVKELDKSVYRWHCSERLLAKSGWENPEDGSAGGGTDDYGFSALPGGSAFQYTYDISNVGYSGYWWTAESNSWRLTLFGGITTLDGYMAKIKVGLSVRCVRNRAADVYRGNLDPLRCAVPRVYFPGFTEGASGTLVGGRSRLNVIRVILVNSPSLRYAYNKRWRQKPGLAGKLTVRFAVNGSGKVISASAEESTLADSSLEAAVVTNVKRWNFERINAFDDVTEVTFPVLFLP
jgi:TonB family protein